MKNNNWKLGLHLMPENGWLNDPNGLCWFNGKYHFFFQYAPGNPEGGLKYWGHYQSTDLINWEYLGIALTPEQPFEINGVYSGSALAEENIMHLFYTGNVKLRGDYNYITEGRQSNTVYACSKDGIHFENKECLLTNDDYPDDLTCHIRDPKVWAKQEDGRSVYYMILGARTAADEGIALIYRSENLKEWVLETRVTAPRPFGYMWECPDVFGLDDEKILSICPQGVAADGLNYQNTYQSGYFRYTGDLCGDYQLNTFKEWDRGFDFYAPQTFTDPKGRRILVGWMGMPDTPQFTNPTVSSGWQHALTIPRELTVRNGKIHQAPVAEMESLRRDGFSLKQKESSPLLDIYEVVIEEIENKDICLRIQDDLTFTYRQNTGIVSLSFADGSALSSGRTKREVKLTRLDHIRMFADRSAIEIYINDGEEVFTTRFYPAGGRSSLLIAECSGQCKIRGWQLAPLNIRRSV